MTISPTHFPGLKEYAWNQFRSGGYISIGWLWENNLTGKSIDEVILLIRDQEYESEASAIDAFTKFLTLEVGDYVAVNNTNAGLFGIGIVTSGYQYLKNKHDTGDPEEHYPHYREVNWKYTNYVRRKDIISPGETGWKPFGTVGSLDNEVPPYIRRLLGEMPPKQSIKKSYVTPDYLKTVINSINQLKSDPQHKEPAHESLVVDFFHELGYEKYQDIKYQQGRVDISLWIGDKILVIIEVKKDWKLSSYSYPAAVKQAYNYALDQGARYVILTNGDYYAIFDRLKGLSITSNLIGEFQLTALEEENVNLIQRMSRSILANTNIEELFLNLSESFKRKK